MALWNEKMLSGNAYITVKMRGSNERTTPLKVSAPHNCNHAEGSVCETAECLNSWSLDWQFFLRRTNRGRSIIEQFHLTDDQVATLESDQFRNIRTSHDPFDPQYDRSSNGRPRTKEAL
jgi:hypothetical protein